MPRPVLEESSIHPAIRDKIATNHLDIVKEVERAVDKHDVVVVGMSQNPFPRRARKALKEKSIPFEYLEYGSYFGPWRRRTALKMWTGWHTFPMIFVKRTFIGGTEELKAMIDSGELDRMLRGEGGAV